MAHEEPSKSYLPWPLRVGRRVVVRHRIDPPQSSGAHLTDITGDLVAADDTYATVATRSGTVRVPWVDVVVAKELPPRPTRPGRPHRTITVDDLQRLMADGLPGLIERPIGDWLLRSAEGFTGRANSVLVVGDPGRSVADAVAEAAATYRDLGRPALFQIAGEEGFTPEAHPVAAQVLARGGRIFQRTLVMTAAVREVALARTAPHAVVDLGQAPSEAWWRAASPRTRDHRDLVERLLTKVHDGRFLTVRHSDEPVAAGRIAYSPGWVGLYDLHAVAEQRGHGFGRALAGAAARDAEKKAVRSAYLQVSADNASAIGLYASLGFTVHHEYWYARLDRPAAAE